MNTTASNAAPTVNPPKGFDSWLDYAVATMDVRQAQLMMADFVDEDGLMGPLPSYDDMRAAAAAELAALRTC